MSDIVIVAVIVALGGVVASVPPTIAAYAALQQSRVNALKTDENTALTEKIHRDTNGNLGLLKTELASANRRIEALQNLVMDLIDKAKQGPEKPS